MHPVRRVLRRLVRADGDAPYDPRVNPLDFLIRATLSQRTHAPNAARGYRRLRRIGSWSRVAAAPLIDVEQAVGVCGFGHARAASIQALLRRLIEIYGRPTLAPLRRLDTDAARAALLTLPGVGPATAELVLLRALGRPVAPVDAGIHRVIRRLGLAPPDATRADVAAALLSAAGPGEHHPLHVRLFTHARDTCQARRPDCPACVLNDLCPKVPLPNEQLADRPSDGLPTD